MRTAPTDPTAALAALISANHRHAATRAAEADRAADAVRPPGGTPPSPTEPLGARPYIAALTSGIGGQELAAVFELSQGSLSILQTGSVGTSSFEVALAAPGIVLLLVAVRLFGMRMESGPSGIARAESEAIAELDVAIRQSPVLRSRLASRRIRAVAVALEDATGRAHWLGEHPAQSEILKGVQTSM